MKAKEHGRSKVSVLFNAKKQYQQLIIIL